METGTAGARAKLNVLSDEMQAKAAKGLLDSSVYLEKAITDKITFQTINGPPLSPETIARKGSSAMLFDKGFLLGDITHDVQSGGQTVQVGVIDSTDKKRAMIAMVHEFGYPKLNIPERSFLRSAYMESTDKMKKLFIKALKS